MGWVGPEPGRGQGWGGAPLPPSNPGQEGEEKEDRTGPWEAA